MFAERRGAPKKWQDSFTFDHVRVLIVCRGPVRMEAIEAFENLGAQPSGILLSEKDSVVYQRALAPELRVVGRNERVHRIPDYAGTNAREKAQRIAHILETARSGGYTHIFAGYGFMAEDHEFIEAIEKAGIGFVDPSSRVARSAGAKDAAKTMARSLGVSVTPGLDDILARTLLAPAKKGQELSHLQSLVKKHSLKPPAKWSDLPPLEAAEQVLTAAMGKSVELVTLQDIQAETRKQAEILLRESPGQRLRFKHVGGGGGKGQRIISKVEEVDNAIFEVLSESRALGPGDNRNFLIELNVEETRHNEIQLLGNGTWCIALGGRDCSLQMHEQKLLEVSITQEQLQQTADQYREAGATVQAAVMETDLKLLREMEEQAERIGEAVGLDSVSTFESIVAGDHHFFMEINTRIQVEHRVTEMVYGLEFTHPDDPEQSIRVESLVEAMLWMAVHGKELPKPTRYPRHGSGAEVRLNATNDALRPHAGGVILSWTPPIEHEVRDDQGIGIPNPDTHTFMDYNLAGAYDSNAALVVSHGMDRRENLERLAEILRRMEVRGEDLMLNKAFHYGLIHWMLGAEPHVKPSTRFVQAYLAAVGGLKLVSQHLDLDEAWAVMMETTAQKGRDATNALAAKVTLILRPLRILYEHPHLMAGWLAPRKNRRWVVEKGRFFWRQNPLAVLNELYRYLRLEEHPGVAPDEKIWEPDQRLLETGLAFYDELRTQLGHPEMTWEELATLLNQPEPPKGADHSLSGATWETLQAAHRGHQLGLALLKLPIISGEEAGFYDLQVNQKLEPIIPKAFLDPKIIETNHQALAPPPPASGNQILAWTGGTFYTSPAPGEPPYVEKGSRFAVGDVVGLLEVMKMFNPIRADFSGTIREILVPSGSGVIVHKGQPLFEVEPDHPVEPVDEEALQQRKREKTLHLMKLL